MMKYLSLLGLLFLLACTSGAVSSPDLNDPLNSIDSAIYTAMSMGIQSYSENRREVFSRPFVVAQKENVTKAGFRDRGRAHVTVLGDERPYTIEVEVSIERAKIPRGNEDAVYKFNHYDKRLAARLLKDILAVLHKELRDRNIIDDFKSF